MLLMDTQIKYTYCDIKNYFMLVSAYQKSMLLLDWLSWFLLQLQDALQQISSGNFEKIKVYYSQTWILHSTPGAIQQSCGERKK